MLTELTVIRGLFTYKCHQLTSIKRSATDGTSVTPAAHLSQINPVCLSRLQLVKAVSLSGSCKCHTFLHHSNMLFFLSNLENKCRLLESAASRF